MTEEKRVFVLVGDEQTPLSPQDVAGMVMGEGYKSATARTGFSESTLRKFLAANGIKSRRPLLLEKTSMLSKSELDIAANPRMHEPASKSHAAPDVELAALEDRVNQLGS